MKKFVNYFVVMFLMLQSVAEAQTVLLHYEKDKEPAYDKGPNQKKFTQGILHFGLVIPGDGAAIQVGSSVSWGIGLRKKFKVSPVYSLGWEFQFDFTDYKYKNVNASITPGNSIPNSYGIDVHRFDNSSIALGMFHRFNFDPGRGNFMGTFFDLAISGKYCFAMTEFYKYKTLTGTARTEISSLDYVYPFQSDLTARLGFSRLSLQASYHLTDFFKSNTLAPELPRLTVGLELGLY